MKGDEDKRWRGGGTGRKQDEKVYWKNICDGTEMVSDHGQRIGRLNLMFQE